MEHIQRRPCTLEEAMGKKEQEAHPQSHSSPALQTRLTVESHSSTMLPNTLQIFTASEIKTNLSKHLTLLNVSFHFSKDVSFG